MESKTVKDAIDALIQARPGGSSPSNDGGGATRDTKRSTLCRRRSHVPSGSKCNCGKCSKCLPSPSGELDLIECNLILSPVAIYFPVAACMVIMVHVAKGRQHSACPSCVDGLRLTLSTSKVTNLDASITEMNLMAQY